MADNTIDTLMLEVESNAEKSADGLDRLAASLAKIGKSVSGATSPLSSFASSIKEATTAINSLGSTREISSLLSQLTQLSRIRLDNLENKKIRIDFELNGVESGQLKYAIQKAIDGVKVDTSAISKQLAQSFNLSKEATAKLQSQMQTIANSMATSFDGKNFHLNDTLDSALEEMAQNIRENGSVIRSSLTDSLDFAMNEYKEFYDYFNTHKIYISDYLKADIGKTEFAEIIQQNLSYITRNAAKGIELNSVWEELSSKFPTLIPPGITNAADQVVHVLEEIKYARDQIKPVAIDDLVSREQTAAMDGVWQSILDSTRNLSTVLSQRIKDATEYAQDKINLDVKVNEEKIIQDIRNAINRAASAQYDPVKVKLSVDSKNIQNSVSQELKGVDPGNLPQISEGMEKIANAMVLMNGVKFKDTGLSSIIKSLENLSGVDTTKFNADGIAGLAGALGTLGYINFKGTGLNSVIKSLRELSSVDMSNFNTDSFSGIVQSISSLGQIPDISAGINKLVASLAKLASSGASITTVAQRLPILGNALREVVDRLASAEDISAAVNVFVQSLARLAGAGAKTTQTAAGLETLGQATLDFFRTMQSAPQISENTLRMTEALSRLAASGANVGQATNATAGAFSSLGNASSRAANITSKAFSALGKVFKGSASLIVKSVESIISAIKTMGNIAGKSLSGILNTTKSVATGIFSSAKSIVSSFTLIGNSGKVFGKVESQLRSIIRTAVPFATVFGAINLAKQSVELSSSLTEVQNVVRTTFGDMTQEVNDFAKSAIQDLGMSELTFKQVASRYQAMGTSMGITSGQVQKATQFLQKNSEMYGKTADSMGDMSIELTRLAADMASFYDVAQEDVAQDLASIFTGATRPLRQYGLDITEATLGEWALKNGIDADMDSMTQAQKAMLRYQYILANTTAAQGDFIRTANTWHNMTTVLSQSFQQLGSIVGEVLINAFKPFVAALNSVMGHVITFARTVADALGKIFGWSLEIDAGGITNDMEDATGYYEDAGDAAGDVADETGDAAKAAKKLKKQLAVLPFDELNQLAKDMEYAADAGKGSGNGNGLDSLVTPETSGFSANFVKGDGLLDKYKSDIDSLYELGDYIGTTLTETLKKIDWDKIYETASGFGSGLASFLNGLISPELFSEIGSTVAGVLNTALHFLDDFGNNFEWGNFGVSLSDGLKSFLTDYDWDLRVENFNTFANGILDTIIAALDNVTAAEWQRIPQKIADMIEAVDATGIGWKLGNIVNSLANAFYQLVANKVTWAELGTKIGEGINSFLKGMNKIDPETKMTGWETLGKDISNSISGITISITKALEKVKWKKVGKSIADFIGGINFGEIGWNLGKLGNALANALYDVVSQKEIWSNLGNNIASGINNFFSAMNNVNEDGFTGWQTLGKGITSSITGIASSITTALQGVHWEEVGQAIADFIGSIDFGQIAWNLGAMANSLANAFYTLVSNKDTWINLGKALSDGLKGFFSGMNEVDPNTNLTGWQALGKSITTSMSGIVTAISTALDGIGFTEIGDALTNLWNSLSPFAESVGQGLVDFLQEVLGVGEDFLKNTLPNGLNSLADALDKISPDDAEAIGRGLGVVGTGLLAFMGLSELGGILTSIAKALTNWSTLKETFGWLSGVTTAAGLVATAYALDQFGIIDVDWGALWDGIGKVKDVLAEFIEKIDWTNITDGLGSLWDAFQKFAEGFANGLISALNVLINDIGAPLINGIAGAFKLLAEALNAIPDGILSEIGEGLGEIAGGLVAINLAKSAITAITGFFGFLGGASVTTATTTAAGGLAGVGAAAETAAGGTGILKTALMSPGGMIAGVVLGTQKLAEMFDAVNGGNGELSELGGAVDTFAGKLAESNAITSQQKDELNLLKEELEDSGATTEEFAEAFIQKLTECGVSSGEFAQIISEMGGTMNVTDEQAKFLNQTLEGLGTAAETMAGKYVQAGTDADEAFGIIEQAIKDTADQTGDYETVNNELLQTFRESYDPALGNIDEAYDKVLTQLQNMGDKTEEVDGKSVLLSETLTNNVNSALGDLATNAGEAATATEGVGTKTGDTVTSILGFIAKSALMALGLGSIKSGGEEAEGKVSSLNTTISTFVDGLSDYAQTALDKGKETGKNYPDGMSTGIEENTSLVSDAGENMVDDLNDAVQDEAGIHSPSTVAKGYGEDYTQGFADGVEGNKSEVNSAAKDIVDELKGVFTDSGTQWDFESAGSSLVEKLLSGMSSTSSYDISYQLSGLISNIKSVFNINDDAYSQGQSVTQSFINGMKNISIPLPHLSFTSTTTFNGSGYSTSTSSSIRWYALGGLFNSPSVIGVGEAGAEAVLPLTNRKVINSISGALLSGMQDLPISRYRLANMEDMKVKHDIPKMSQSQMARMQNSQIDNTELMDAITGAVVTAMMNNRQNPINVTCYAELKTENDEVLARAVTRGQKSLDYRYNPTPKFGY